MKKILSNLYIRIGLLLVVGLYALYTIYSHLDFLSDPKYIEVINQFRGSSNSFFAKLFFNKLLFIYFYLQNISELFNFYSWIAWFGLSTTIVFIVSLFRFAKSISLFSVVIFTGIILPLGFIKDLKDTNMFMFFLPIIIYYIGKYLFSLSKRNAGIIVGVILLELVVLYIWPINIIL